MASQVLAVKIDVSLKSGKSIPEAAEGYWHITSASAVNVTTLVAISKQKVVGVFSVDSPSLVLAGKDKGRIIFSRLVGLNRKFWTPYQAMEPFTFTGPLKFL